MRPDAGKVNFFGDYWSRAFNITVSQPTLHDDSNNN